jgi:putative transposase
MGNIHQLLSEHALERKGAKLVEIDRWFPSSKLCSNCFHQVGEMSLDVREWACPHCGTHHDRDGNAAINIRAEGIRALKAEGSAVWSCRRGGKTKAWTKVSSSALAIEYRSPHYTRYSELAVGSSPHPNYSQLLAIRRKYVFCCIL